MAKVVRIGSVTPLVPKTPENPDGTPIEVLDGFREASMPTVSQFFKDLAISYFGADRQEIGCEAIGIEFFFVDLKSYPSWIVVAFGSIIDRAHDALTLREFRCNSIANIGGEGGNAAMAWKVISEKAICLILVATSMGLVAISFSRFSRIEMSRFCNLRREIA